jgi:hypothetical protein
MFNHFEGPADRKVKGIMTAIRYQWKPRPDLAAMDRILARNMAESLVENGGVYHGDYNSNRPPKRKRHMRLGI